MKMMENSSSREEFGGKCHYAAGQAQIQTRSKILSCSTLNLEQIGGGDGRIPRLASISVGLTRQLHPDLQASSTLTDGFHSHGY
jgi:hypothetical protein